MELSRLFDGRKFMWDGKEYHSATESREQEEHYRSLGFEVRSLNEGDMHYLYTRRVVLNSLG
ncbi:hypothetical protein Dform_00939 [Dehalogenimonas formicexedens]|uniref:Uncharacterized protein n=1 Tax=Dehalogenimonas formicexedens TaxID=1839801 RepID=A0A1P8F757_9CHLR|nr:hypothetical protein [Dehalogenimonas formicexedens]APV44280.1 hypothetical protein Dform_00939 [Dehalogenimonas formicexedens]